MKHVSTLLLLMLFFASCKPTANIITSKNEAQKKGLYKTSENKRIVVKPNPKNVSKPLEIKEADKKIRLDDSNAEDYVINVDHSNYMIRQLINSASQNLGAGYRTGGTTPEGGFDCSGLMFSTFKKFDITLPRSSNDMAKVGKKLNNDDIKKGDLIFFRTNGKSVINHVGMVTEVSRDEIKFIHSSTQKGVIISSTKEPYYNRTFAQANRILQ